jgi:CHAD domain-containing protein
MGPDTEATSWREVEVELTEHGGVDQLDRIEKRLLDAGARRSGSASKLSRVLADRLADNADHPDEPGTAGPAVLAYLHDQTDTLRRYDPLVRQDAPDSVHKMRVASRRLRSAMQAYRRVLDRDITAPLTEELKWLAGELAPARNTEVMAERFAKMVDTLPAELVLGPVSATLDRTLTRRQAQARERALAALDSDRYLALHDAIDMLLADLPPTRTASQPAHRELPTSVRRAHRRLRRRMAEVDQRPAGAARDLALHEARKAAKRLRYAQRPPNPRWASRPLDCASTSSPYKTCSAITRTPSWPARCCANSAPRRTSTAATALPSDCCTVTSRPAPSASSGALPDRWKRLQRPKNIRWLNR